MKASHADPEMIWRGTAYFDIVGDCSGNTELAKEKDFCGCGITTVFSGVNGGVTS
jgi:hypothetical protein